MFRPPYFLQVLWVVVSGLPAGDPLSIAGRGRGLRVWLSVVSCCGPVVVAVAFSGHGPLGPLPLPLFFFLSFPAGGRCCVRVSLVGGLPLPRRGSVPACPGCFFLWPVGGCGAVVVRFLCPGLVGLYGVVSGCPIGGARGRRPWCRLVSGAGCPPRWSGCVASRLWGCLLCFPPLPLAGECALVGWGGQYGCFLFVRGPGFPSSLWFFFGGGGFACSPLLPSLDRRMHWALNGVANCLAVRVAVCCRVVGCCGPCPGSVCLLAYVHA